MTNHIDLNQLKSKPHPLRAKLRKQGVTNDMLANYLELSYPYVCNLLAGMVKMPKHQEAKINALLFSLTSQEQDQR